MVINDFIEQLQTLTGQPTALLPHRPTVHVAVNNAAYRRPSAALIEVAGMPDLSLLVANLQADYGGRTLVLGRAIWRAGERSRSKRRLSELVDAFLAGLDVELDEPLSDGPVCYVGHPLFGGARETRARSLVNESGIQQGIRRRKETRARSLAREEVFVTD